MHRRGQGQPLLSAPSIFRWSLLWHEGHCQTATIPRAPSVAWLWTWPQIVAPRV